MSLLKRLLSLNTKLLIIKLKKFRGYSTTYIKVMDVLQNVISFWEEIYPRIIKVEEVVKHNVKVRKVFFKHFLNTGFSMSVLGSNSLVHTISYKLFLHHLHYLTFITHLNPHSQCHSLKHLISSSSPSSKLPQCSLPNFGFSSAYFDCSYVSVSSNCDHTLSTLSCM